MGNAATIRISDAQARLQAAGGHHIGDLTAWNTTSLDVDRDKVRAIFADENLAHCVPGIELGTALYRANAETRPAREAGLRVLPFAKPNPDTPTAFGVYTVAGTGEAGDALRCGARIRIDLKAGSVVALPPENGDAIEACLAHAESVATAANHLMTHAQTRDVSAAMIRSLAGLGAVPLRDRGGFYLVPPSSAPAWRRLAASLKAIGVDPITIEMHDSPANVAEAGRAAKGALEEDVQALLEDLKKAADEGLGKRALGNRVKECQALAARAELFRGVLQSVTDDITGHCEAMRNAFQRALDEAPQEDADLFQVPVAGELVAS